MDAIRDWELHNAPHINEDGTVEVTIRKWEHSETFNALEFLAEVSAELGELDDATRKSAEIYFRTWDDVDGCPSREVILTCRRVATERELRISKAAQIKSVREDRAWMQQRVAMLIEDAAHAGLSPEDIGITTTDGGYSLSMIGD